MASLSPANFDQFVHFAMTCNVICYVKTQTNPVNLYTVFAGPLDMVVTNVSEANFQKALAAFPDMQLVASITP